MVRFPNGFAIQPEFLYTQKGVKVSLPTVDVTVKTDFIDVPVLARYTFGKVVRGYIFGGPSFDFKVSAKLKASGSGSSQDEVSNNNVKSFEFALVAGGGVELGPFLLEARWSEGLTDISKAPTAASPTMKTRTILFLGGFRF